VTPDRRGETRSSGRVGACVRVPLDSAPTPPRNMPQVLADDLARSVDAGARLRLDG
jgi:hypothetical protein